MDEEIATCNYLVPRFDDMVSEDEIVECLLPPDHGGMHLCLLPSGTYIEWEPYCGGADDDCDDVECEDFVSKELTADEARQRLLAQQPIPPIT